MTIKETIVNYLKYHARKKFPSGTEEELLGCYYLEAGLLDSVGVVEMILEFEDTFGIRLDPDQLRSNEFRTIGGLIRIIETLVGGKK